jgi:sugar transferase (PEP-CTERM/EpsH1 system associated)
VHKASGDRPVRVMHVLFSLRTGGTELGVVKLANALDRSRVVSAICSCKPADAVKSRLRSDVKLFEFDRRDGNDPMFVARLARLFRRERPDVVHTHSWGTLCEGLVAARLAGVRRVVHGEHGTMETRGHNLRVQRLAWGWTDGVLSVSSRLAERLSAQVGYPLDSIKVIRNGIDTARFRPDKRDAARHSFGLGPRDVVIGTAGRLVPVKDHATLLNALALLKSQGVAFRAIIAGDGPLRATLAALAGSTGLAHAVDFLGERGDIEDVMAACDVFALSSTSEGLSNTIMEAMATGLPVVATDVGGTEELVEDGRTGLLVPPSDPAAFAAALADLAKDEAKRHSMGLAGRQRMERDYSLDRMIHAYEELYLGLNGRAPAASPCVA